MDFGLGWGLVMICYNPNDCSIYCNTDTCYKSSKRWYFTFTAATAADTSATTAKTTPYPTTADIANSQMKTRSYTTKK